MAHVIGRQRSFTSETRTVLWKQYVVTLSAGSAAVINRLGPSVVRDQADTLTETARQFHASGVVVPAVRVIHVGENTEVRERTARIDAGYRSWSSLINVRKAIEVPALRAQIASFHYPFGTKLPLHVQQELHGVRSGVVVRGSPGKWRRYLNGGSAPARDRIAPGNLT